MNKPVAWMELYCGKPSQLVWKQEEAETIHPYSVIPLYTHPVKELTDEEIMEIVADKYEKGHGRYIDTKLFFVEFARAILKKAQEK